MSRCDKCGQFKVEDCVKGVIDPENDAELAYTCLNLEVNIIERTAMPETNSIEDQVQQLRVNRSNLRGQIPGWTGSAFGLQELNYQIGKLTETIIRLNMSDPDATEDQDDNL